MTLNPGDIAFVQYNADGTDNFAFVALEDIPGNEVILFTDNGWLGDDSGFRANEGVITWTAPAGGVTAGTVVTIDTAPSASVGSVTTSGSLNFSASGDQVIAYQENGAAITPITALNNEGAAVFQADAADSNTSALPQGLTVGSTAVAITEIDNAVYTGPTTGDKATLQAALNDSANWSGDNGTNQTFAGTFNIGGGNNTVLVGVTATDADAAEESQDPGTFTVSRTGDTSDPLTVTYTVGGTASNDDSDFTPTLTGSVTIAAGSSTADITVTPVDDSDIEGAETVTVTLIDTADYDLGATTEATVTIADNDVAPPTVSLVINEILADPDANNGDANGDGTVSTTQDEFVEIVNTGSESVDISGWTLSDGFGVRHTFPAGTVLAADQAIVIFAGGTPTGDFGGALVQTAGSLGLNNGGDTVTLNNGTTDVAAVTYGGEGGNNQSLTRDPDLTGDFTQHSGATGANGALFSPGTQIDGTAFGGVSLPNIAINELRISSSGSSDDDSNFVEIFGAAGTSLDNVSLVVLSGEFNPGQVDFAFDLTGLTIDEDGLLLVANPGITNEIPQAVTEANDLFTEFDFFGSPSTFLLVSDFTGTQGADLDLDNDGTLDAAIGTVIDSVSLVDGDGTADISYSTTVIGPSGSFSPAGVARAVDGTGTFQKLDFGSFAADTPGTSNEAPPPPLDPTPIAEIQGSGNASPLVGIQVLTSGIVTKVLEEGFYIQTPDGQDDGDASTSEGIFIFTDAAPQNSSGNAVEVGDAVEVTGTVAEAFSQTQISTSSGDIDFQSAENPLPDFVQVSLPGLEQADLEAFEGMRFELVSSGADSLVVIENFNLDRFGEITVAEGIQTQPTQIFDPDTQDAEIQALRAQNTNERLLLDDGVSSQNPTEFAYLPATVGDDGDGILDAEDTFSEAGPTVRLGSELTTSVQGVLGFGFSEYRLFVDNTIGLDPATNEESRPQSAPEVGGDVTVASFNVLNYFTTIDVSGAGTGPNGDLDPRGADSTSELERQTDKLVAALIELDADIIGLQEIENNGTIAIDTLVNELNAALDAITPGSGTYAFVDPTGNGDFIGTDAITTGIIYDTSAVSLVESDFFVFEESSAETTFALADVLNQVASSDDQVGDFQRNRPAVAATFEDANGEQFTVAVNHFKSKGDSNLEDVVVDAQNALDNGNTTITQGDIDALIADPNYDQGDGQGFWNQVRADAGAELVDWLTDTSADGYAGGTVTDPDFLIIGDLNAYAQEDPVDAIEAGANGESFNDLIDDFAPGGQESAYSFVFDGQRGSLDHALGTDTLTEQVTGVAEWHINADEPDLLNYDESFNDSRFYDDNLFGASDHDPLLIGLDLGSSTVPTVKGVPATIFVDDSNTVVGNAFQAGQIYAGNLFSNTDGQPNPDDVILGTSGNDNIWGGIAGGDLIDAGEGNDTIGFGDGDSHVCAGAGDDFVYAAGVGAGLNIIELESGNDNFWAAAGDNLITGSDNNTIGIGTGNDEVTTEAGDDFVYTVNGGGGTNTLDLGDGTNTVYVENGDYDILTGTGNDSIGLGTGTDTVIAGDGNNIIYMIDVSSTGAKDILTGSGDDFIQTGAGNDTVDGGLGTDTVQFAGTEADYSFSGVADNFTITGADIGTDTLMNIETLFFTGSNTVVDTTNLSFV